MFKNGEQVMCIDDQFDRDTLMQTNQLPIEGEEYIVDYTEMMNGQVGVYLIGFNDILLDGSRIGFKSRRFTKPDISQLTEILQNEESLISSTY